jgi:hypothetical protein
MFQRKKLAEGFFGFIDSTERGFLGAAVLALNFAQSTAETLQNMTNGTNTTSFSPTTMPTLSPTKSDHATGNIIIASVMLAPFVCCGLYVLCRSVSDNRSNDNSDYIVMGAAAGATGVAADSCCDSFFNSRP